MGLFDVLFRSRDKPVTDSINGSGYRFLFGGSTSGKLIAAELEEGIPA